MAALPSSPERKQKIHASTVLLNYHDLTEKELFFKLFAALICSFLFVKTGNDCIVNPFPPQNIFLVKTQYILYR